MVTAAKKSRTFVRHAAFFAAAILPLAMLAAGIHWNRIWLAARLGNHLEQAPEQEVAARLEQLAGLDDAGLPALVDALHHESRTRRKSAKLILDAKLEAWRQLPAEQSRSSVLALVKLLATRSHHASAEALSVSADLALQVLAFPSSQRNLNQTELTYCCEQILSAARRSGVIAEPIDMDGSFRIDTRADLGGTGEDPLALGLPPKSPPLPPAEILPRVIPEPDRAAAASTDLPDGGQTVSNVRPASTLAALTDAEVIARVADEKARAAAEIELQRRGFSQLDIRLARAVSDPDPTRREQLVQSLPQLAGIDTRSWLLLMLHDPAPRVRAAAARWLATSEDPELREHLRELAQQETDESVREALRKSNALR